MANPDLSVSLIAASDSELFTIPPHNLRDNSKDFIDKLDADSINVRIYGGRSGRRAVRAHGALATILVSQPTDEVIAVGTSKSEDGLFTIYITASGEKASLLTLNKARLHLEDVWNLLARLVDEQPQRETETPPTIDLRTSSTASELVFCIYQHSRERVMERFGKSEYLGVESIIVEAVFDSPAYVMDDPPRSQGQPYILRSELGTLLSLAMVIGLFHSYRKDQNDGNLRALIGGIERACAELDRLGPAVWGESPDSLFSRCDRLMKERKNIGLTKEAAFHRFWKKAFSLHRAIKQLLYLTVSPNINMRVFLKAPIEVEVVPPTKGLFEYDLTSDSFRAVFDRVPRRSISMLTPTEASIGSAIESESSDGSRPMDISQGSSSRLTTASDQSKSSDAQLTYDKFCSSFSAKRPLVYNRQVDVHCELTLLAHFLTRQIEAYGFIAVSKLCCLGCWFYFLAYNEVAKSSGRRPFYVLGTHSKAYRGWTKPSLDPGIDQAIEPVLAEQAEAHFQLIETQFTPRKWSDSSSGHVTMPDFSQSDFTDEKIEGAIHMLQQRRSKDP